ncbi:uncharacterized protein LOC106068497 [Biomphalaria glabrata]|uniref:Uncharacterized protein LOC106068497 n=1 Tax=Biomphalaria glabrata TaxID=6526 RepID=A0A2C9KLJ7_BIOGL|nr:uncharacterized protein LOC106068497 [Biomphalaria glabrata]
MGEPEACSDGIEVNVLFPTKEEKMLTNMLLTDVVGRDLTVEQVKTRLFQEEGIPNSSIFILAFHDELTNRYINPNQSNLITDYSDYFVSGQFTIIFLECSG